MRRIRFLLAAILAAVFAVPLSAQSAPSNFGEEISGQFEASAGKLVALAQAMPSDTYSWRPMEGVYSVARVYTHISRYNYMYPDQSLGIESPMGPAEYGRWEEEVGDKEKVVGILSASLDHVRVVMNQMSEKELSKPTSLYGREVGQWAVLLQLVTHMNEHLGQAIAYARMNQVVPPWSS
ncbi:MAG TPA: DinB family protein [Gemmatimonadetes bacterium]|jgi:uncharacterized damage-inducible protein DinB|nr:DinB family protein [Gemmatimonadota bacterium]HIA73922.1 DinB family protein [Gemmatimonadota bacterium]HIN78837.1 DinB family protein [Gemmatimonadota bacterium]